MRILNFFMEVSRRQFQQQGGDALLGYHSTQSWSHISIVSSGGIGDRSKVVHNHALRKVTKVIQCLLRDRYSSHLFPNWHAGWVDATHHLSIWPVVEVFQVGQVSALGGPAFPFWSACRHRRRSLKHWNRDWRRERDSNPRYPFGYSGFQDRLFQPLTHPSA